MAIHYPTQKGLLLCASRLKTHLQGRVSINLLQFAGMGIRHSMKEPQLVLVDKEVMSNKDATALNLSKLFT